MTCLCAIINHTFTLFVQLAAWNVTSFTVVKLIETICSNLFTLLAFILYVLTGLFILKVRKTSAVKLSVNEMQLLMSFALSFAFEMFTIVVFHHVLPNMNLPPYFYGLSMMHWESVPGFNGLMLLIVNRSFRRRFFAMKMRQFEKTTTVAPVEILQENVQ